MCYSAQTWAEYRKYTKVFGAVIDIKEFVKLYGFRYADPRVKIPKAMDAGFAAAAGAEEAEVQRLIDAFNAAQATKLEQELFTQKKRLNDAERRLQTKETKKDTESVRIATDKISRAQGRLADLRRIELKDRDSRIFPGWYAPVLMAEAGRLVVKPMRYQCRPAGKPAFYDTKYPGTYNARRDNLEKFWKGQFGHTHGIMVVNRFYENVDRDGANAVLEFRPEPAHDMLVACLWSRWEGDGEELLSFAAITDDPPAEVAAAGHDRCIVPIKPENLEAWLNPGGDLPAMQRILDDRDRPFYEHRLAA